MRSNWYSVVNVSDVPSPALLVYPDRVEENIRRMIAIAGGVERLRPHIKTHKLAEVVRMQMALGIKKFKCATIAEAEMAASCGAPDVLLAYQAVGPNAERLVQLVKKFPKTQFSVIADDAVAIRVLSKSVNEAGAIVEVLLDIDCGQHRTGVAPGPKAIELYRLIASPTLPAIPLLTACGYVLAESHAAVRLVRFFRALLGWMPGGVAVLVATVCALFTAFTGGSGVTIIALGGLVYPDPARGRLSGRILAGARDRGG